MYNYEQSIKVNLSKKNILKFQVSFWVRKWYFWLFSFFFAISLFSLADYIGNDDLSNIPGTLTLFLLIFIMFFLMIIFNTIAAIRNKSVYEERRYSFTGEHFLFESDTMTQKIRWEDIEGYMITKDQVSLFISQQSAHMIPLDSLAVERQKDFVAFITEKAQKQQGKGSKDRNTSKPNTRSKNSFALRMVIFFILMLIIVAVIQRLNT